MSDIDHESSSGPERLYSWTKGLVKYAIGVTYYLPVVVVVACEIILTVRSLGQVIVIVISRSLTIIYFNTILILIASFFSR